MGSNTSKESHVVGKTTKMTTSEDDPEFESAHQKQQGRPMPSFSRAHSLPPAVHHPPQAKGDSFHVVAHTSSTYGSLVLDQLADSGVKSQPEKTDALELMHDLEDPPDSADSPDWADAESAPVRRSASFDHGRRSLVSHRNHASSFGAKPLWMHFSDGSSSPNSTIFSTPKRAVAKTTDSAQLTPPSTLNSNILPVDKALLLPPPRSEGKIVLYFTSLRGVRRTFQDCCAVRWILRGLRVRVDERDVSMDSEYRRELQIVFGGNVALPQVFVGGKYLGGAEEIKQLHEMGELRKTLQGFPLRESGEICQMCGDARFIPCENCHGSRKLYWEEDIGGSPKRCLECNENGLIRCLLCSS